MDAAVGNLADAGEQPALDREAYSGTAGARRGAAGSLPGRGTGPGSGRGLASSRACYWRVSIAAASALRLLAERERAVGFGQRETARAAATACRWRRLEARPARSRRALQLAAGCASQPARRGPARAGAQLVAASRFLARARRCGAASTGRVAASSERTWTSVLDRAGLDQRQRRRAAAPSSAAPRSAEPPAPGVSASRARWTACARGDDRDPALGGGDIGLGRLDPRGERRGLGAARARRRRSRAAPGASRPASAVERLLPPRACAARRRRVGVVAAAR